jgi:hypothetical protein
MACNVDHPSARVALGALVSGDDYFFNAYSRQLAVELGAPVDEVRLALRGVDVLDGLFAPDTRETRRAA